MMAAPSGPPPVPCPFPWRFVAIVAVAIAGVVIYGLFDPSTAGFFPRCPIRWLTGYDCPGCGSQRAIHCMLHADVGGAWGYNPMFVIAIPFLILLTVSRFYSLRGRLWANRLYLRLSGAVSCYIITAVIVAWWILRNIYHW